MRSYVRFAPNAGHTMTAPDPAHNADLRALLLTRAESYWRDARELRKMGSAVMAVAYETIATELRACASGAVSPHDYPPCDGDR